MAKASLENHTTGWTLAQRLSRDTSKAAQTSTKNAFCRTLRVGMPFVGKEMALLLGSNLVTDQRGFARRPPQKNIPNIPTLPHLDWVGADSWEHGMLFLSWDPSFSGKHPPMYPQGLACIRGRPSLPRKTTPFLVDFSGNVSNPRCTPQAPRPNLSGAFGTRAGACPTLQLPQLRCTHQEECRQQASARGR